MPRLMSAWILTVLNLISSSSVSSGSFQQCLLSAAGIFGMRIASTSATKLCGSMSGLLCEAGARVGPSVRHTSNQRHCVSIAEHVLLKHADQAPLASTRGVYPGLCAPRPELEPYNPRVHSPRMTWDQTKPYTPPKEACSQAQCVRRPKSKPCSPRARSPRMIWNQNQPNTPLEKARSRTEGTVATA